TSERAEQRRATAGLETFAHDWQQPQPVVKQDKEEQRDEKRHVPACRLLIIEGAFHEVGNKVYADLYDLDEAGLRLDAHAARYPGEQNDQNDGTDPTIQDGIGDRQATELEDASRCYVDGRTAVGKADESTDHECEPLRLCVAGGLNSCSCRQTTAAIPTMARMKPTIVRAGRVSNFLSSSKPPITGTNTTIANCQLMFAAATRNCWRASTYD